LSRTLKKRELNAVAKRVSAGEAISAISTEMALEEDTLRRQVAALKWKERSEAESKNECSSVTKTQQNAFINLGLFPDEVYQRIADGIRFPDKLNFEGVGDQVIAAPVPDFKTRLEYMKEWGKMTGAYPSEVQGGINNSKNVFINIESLRGRGAAVAVSEYMKALKG
jgi:hypothetical protein